MASAYVYMLRCVDNSLYTGYTSCLNRRLQQHQSGRGAKYTKTRLPVKLVWFKECASARIARQWEYHIKQLTKKEKELLLQPQQTHHKKLLEKIRQSTDEGLPMPAK